MEQANEIVLKWIHIGNVNKELNLSNLKLTSLPKIPSEVKYLVCIDNYITKIEELPTELVSLNISKNDILELCPLPPKLNYLNCYNNKLSKLPSLPLHLNFLNCGRNLLTELPSLPKNLTNLICLMNQLTDLPKLPPKLTLLNVKDNHLTLLKNLPNTLQTLNCSKNDIVEMTQKLSHLKILDISKNRVNKLYLSPNLIELKCKYNQLFHLDLKNLSKLTVLNVAHNPITKLDNLPKSLVKFNFSDTLIHQIPYLNKDLQVLKFNNCGINECKYLPPNLTYLSCHHNNLVKLPTLPSKLEYLNISYNRIESLLRLPSNVIIVLCQDNQISNISNFPSSLKFISYHDNPLETNIPKELQPLSNKIITEVIEYKGETINIMTLKKGTLLFRGVNKNEVGLEMDFLGLKFEGIHDAYYMSPHYNVFFYPYPFVIDSVFKVDTMLTYVLTTDVKVVMGVLPSNNTRLDKDSNLYMGSCSQIDNESKIIGRTYDPCLQTDLLKEHMDLNGIVCLEIFPEIPVKSMLKNSQYNKYYKLYEDSMERYGVPEIILHPRRVRHMKELVTPEKEYTGFDYIIEREKEFNYKPLFVESYGTSKDKKIYEQFIDKLISNDGVEVDGVKYRATKDTNGFWKI